MVKNREERKAKTMRKKLAAFALLATVALGSGFAYAKSGDSKADCCFVGAACCDNGGSSCCLMDEGK